VVVRLSDALCSRPALVRMLAWANVVLGAALGIYTGILLNTMVARPLWNSAILGPLFLVSGLSAGAAVLHLATAMLPRRRVSGSAVRGALAALWQPLGEVAPPRRTVDGLIRADLAFLAVELVLIGLLLANLFSSSASHIAAGRLLVSGAYAPAFWWLIVVAGLLVPISLQGLELRHRIPHTIVPALLVLVGGFALRWIMVNAGQASHIVHAAGF
jgi:formate-dependent nitrite reductase membrane component NrfD